MSLLAVVTLASESADDADDVQNTFAIAGTVSEEDVTTGVEVALNAAFRDFYNVLPSGGASSLAGWLSPQLDNGSNACRLDLYDITTHLDGSPHGSPFSSTLFTLAASTSSAGLPSEVCVAITLEGVDRDIAPVEVPDGPDAGTAIDRPKQRRTGRIFLGPLGNAVPATIGGNTRPQTAFLTDCRMAIDELDARITAAVAPTALGSLGVWSRADAAIYTVDFVSTDDAFDTQRRRGCKPTGRTRLAV